METFRTRAERLNRPTKAHGVDPTPTPTTGHWFFTHQKAIRLRPAYRQLTRTALRVLDAVICHADAEGIAWPSIRTIATFCPGTSNSNIARAIAENERLGFFRVERRGRQHGFRYVLWRDAVCTESTSCGRNLSTRRVDGTCPRNIHGNTHPEPEKNDRARSSLGDPSEDRSSQEKRATTSVVSSDETAIGIVRDVCPDFDDRALVDRFVSRFGLPSLRRTVEDVSRRKPKTMKNRPGYLHVVLTEQLDIVSEQDGIEYEAALEEAWAPTLLPVVAPAKPTRKPKPKPKTRPKPKKRPTPEPAPKPTLDPDVSVASRRDATPDDDATADVSPGEAIEDRLYENAVEAGRVEEYEANGDPSAGDD